jgi:DNA-directed RNA polymerase sigma subunit (sigma70/sigma32)
VLTQACQPNKASGLTKEIRVVKISLNLGQSDIYTSDVDKEKALGRDVLSCRKGDWEAKARVVNAFMPLLTSLAKKRASDSTSINRYIEQGKEGLMNAARHFKESSHTKFQIFAMSYIENAMDRVDHPGLFTRITNLFH